MTTTTAQYADDLAGKVVVDITNSLDFQTFDALVVPADVSAAAHLATELPSSRRLRVFNTTFVTTLVAKSVVTNPTTVLIPGGDTHAKGTVMA